MKNLKEVFQPISYICFKITLLTIVVITLLSLVTGVTFFIQDSENSRIIEEKRLQTLMPLVMQPLTGEIIVENQKAIPDIIEKIKAQYGFKELYLSTQVMHCPKPRVFHWLAHYKQACAQSPIPYIKPQYYIMIISDVPRSDYSRFFALMFEIVMPFFLFALIVTIMLQRKLHHFVVVPLEKLSGDPEGWQPHEKEAALEVVKLHQKILSFLQEREIQHMQEEKIRIQASTIDVATQVAHDIRSPLAALQVFLKQLHYLPEEYRTMVRSAIERIADIASNLLSKTNVRAIDRPKNIDSENIALLIESVVAEKRVEFLEKDVVLLLNIADDAYDFFVQIDALELKRTLSNLINNAFEAITQKGTVEIYVQRLGHQIKVIIRDNGCGIPKHILPKILQEGISYGKPGGTGMGLSRAIKAIEEYRGQLILESEENVGTVVTILLPEADPPEWFLKKLVLSSTAKIVVLDDDSFIHDIWRRRFALLRVAQQSFKIMDYRDPNELIKKMDEFRDENIVFLIDYQFSTKEINGIDLIKSFQLNSRSYLVTSQYENLQVRELCKRLGIKIIPKNFAATIPIEVMHEAPDLILIDDDVALTMAWKLRADMVGKNLMIYHRPNELLETLDQFPFDTPIYIDSNLSSDISGEQFAKILYDKGYKNLYLATGYSKEKFGEMPWIKDIVGKEPPF